MGTLIGLRRSLGSTYAEVAARHGLVVEAAAIDRVFPSLLGQAPPLAFKGLEGEGLREAERNWWGERIEETMRAVGGVGAPEDLRLELFERFADPALWQVYPDVAERLERWHRSGLRLAVVSNFDQRLHGLLRALGVDRWLAAVVVSSRAGAAKPSPEPFRQALAALGVGPDRAWHVGDSDEDAAGAHAAGLRCVLVRRP
jgi:putative hydrolase of the HAD superfamily